MAGTATATVTSAHKAGRNERGPRAAQTHHTRAIIAAMDRMLAAPAATAFEAVASLVSLAAYVGIATLALGRRRDSSARVFLVVALTSAVPYVLSALQWWKGSGVYRPATIALTAAAFS